MSAKPPVCRVGRCLNDATHYLPILLEMSSARLIEAQVPACADCLPLLPGAEMGPWNLRAEEGDDFARLTFSDGTWVTVERQKLVVG